VFIVAAKILLIANICIILWRKLRDKTSFLTIQFFGAKVDSKR